MMAKAGGHQPSEVLNVDASSDVVQNFVLDPDLPGVSLEAFDGGNKNIDLIWHTGGVAVDVVGSWWLTFDWDCDGADGTVQVDFFEDGTGMAEDTEVIWGDDVGTVNLTATEGCDAVDFKLLVYVSKFWYDLL